MPGYYVHLATANAKARQNQSFICGVETPDLLKYYFKTYGMLSAEEKYNALKTKDMPHFDIFKERLKQKETTLNNKGLHYGLSSNPDILTFWNGLNEKEKNNPFYRGYLWHLLTDLLVYSYLDIDNRIEKNLRKIKKKDRSILRNQEIKKLHDDWDKTNYKIITLYPDIILPKEIEELNIVHFINNEKTFYVNFDIIKVLIDYMQLMNPLDDDISNIIETVMNLSEQAKVYVKKL